jgi:hypothetical protein
MLIRQLKGFSWANRMAISWGVFLLICFNLDVIFRVGTGVVIYIAYDSRQDAYVNYILAYHRYLWLTLFRLLFVGVTLLIIFYG